MPRCPPATSKLSNRSAGRLFRRCATIAARSNAMYCRIDSAAVAAKFGSPMAPMIWATTVDCVFISVSHPRSSLEDLKDQHDNQSPGCLHAGRGFVDDGPV